MKEVIKFLTSNEVIIFHIYHLDDKLWRKESKNVLRCLNLKYRCHMNSAGCNS